MSTARRRDTPAEVALRRELHRRGRRFRVIFKVPGNRRRTIDIAFPRQRLAVFIDGCFWHGCPDHGNMPSSNLEWWIVKLGANAARDKDTDRLLESGGWTVLRLWEHVTAKEGADAVEAALDRLARTA
jgi:DNA mismatch endonuclease (patch repair protein)